MEIKLKLLKHEKPFVVIETGDFYNHKSHFVEEKINIKKDKKDIITTTNLIGDGVVIVDSHMNFSTPQIIKYKIKGESIIMNFICCNNMEFDIEDVRSEKYSRENTHNILYTSDFNATFKMPADEEINYLTIILSPNFYSRLINEDWNLHQKFSKNISQKKSGYLTPRYAPFTSAIQWVIHEIKNCQYEGAIKKMYIETKIKELLILQLDTLIKKPQTKTIVSTQDYHKLLEAKEILDNNFTNAPTLSELSRLISLNEFKLKKGFKACFEITIKSYVTKLRMEYAKELFKNDAVNVGEVAYKCGYKDLSHFSSVFKIFYGFTPISFKKIIMSVKLHLFFYLEFFDFISIIELI